MNKLRSACWVLMALAALAVMATIVGHAPPELDHRLEIAINDAQTLSGSIQMLESQLEGGVLRHASLRPIVGELSPLQHAKDQLRNMEFSLLNARCAYLHDRRELFEQHLERAITAQQASQRSYRRALALWQSRQDLERDFKLQRRDV